jgi:hypothetical protein
MEFEARNMVDQEVPRDEILREQMERQLGEAAERATWHRVEAERWERIGRSAGASLKALNDPSPVQQVTPETLVGDGGVRATALPFQHEAVVGHPAGARSEGGLSHP